jgi:hypothetical protein
VKNDRPALSFSTGSKRASIERVEEIKGGKIGQLLPSPEEICVICVICGFYLFIVSG